MIEAAERLTLAEKGPFAPAPSLSGPAGRVAREIAAWPGILAATHWRLGAPGTVDGADFYVGAEELGHIHLDGDVHLATTLALREALLARRFAKPLPWYASWVCLPIRNDTDAAHALRVVRLNYDRLAGVPMANLLARIEAALGL